MKKFTYLLFLAIGVVGCSVESMDSSENLLTADARFKAANSSEMLFLEIVCAGEETTITVNFPQRTNTQGTLLPTTVKVEVKLDDVWTEIYNSTLNGVTTTSFKYTFNDAIEYELRYSAEPGKWNDPQFLEVIDCCEESFSYIDNGNGTYTFTYVPAEDMSGAHLVFTFAQGVEVEGLDESWSSNGVTMQSDMNLEECEVYSWTVTLSANCSGKSGKSNVWTDFTVNDISQKEDPDDKFIASCD